MAESIETDETVSEAAAPPGWTTREITSRLDGTFVIITDAGYPYHVVADDPAYHLDEVVAAWDGLPEGDARRVTEAPSPEPTADELAAQRIAEIDARLTAIDLASVRALRATVAGVATEDDAAQLAALETEAAALRAERAGLAAS